MYQKIKESGYRKQYYKKNRERMLEYARMWRRKKYHSSPEVKERLLSVVRASYAKFADKRREYARLRRIAIKQNPEKLEQSRAWKRKFMAEKVKSDPNFAMRKRLRTRIIGAVKRQNITHKSHD